MRYLLVILLVLFLLLQYRLWISDEGMQEMWRLRELVSEQAARNIELERRNDALEAEVRDLRQGKDAVEERARSDLGMIRDQETFFQIVGDEYPATEPATGNADAADEKP
ncbi:MAG: cell division protein FtsB [Proteobacteria bacterium]|nr:cell division protein FtsB [Pseudomonadota bacterium]MCH9026949.1 cell division protein FtsB [Pseudomonadota bacterium]